MVTRDRVSQGGADSGTGPKKNVAGRGVEGDLVCSMTNMGAFAQPQGHLQLILNLTLFGMDPQSAIDAPRFCIEDGTQGGAVSIEEGWAPDTVTRLERMGHPAKWVKSYDRKVFGRAQIITRDPDGILCGGSDPRADGCAIGF